MTEIEIEVALNDHQNEIGSLKHRMDKVESKTDDIHELASSIKLLTQAQTNLVKSVDELKTDVKQIKEIPTQKWNSATQTIVSGVISAIVCAIMGVILANIH